MSLQSLLDTSKKYEKIEISEERIEAIKPVLRQYIAFWREYPDMFIDFLQSGRDGEIPANGLHFYFYQRVLLRISVRFRQVYAVFPRGFSKSFIAVLSMMIRCILYPGAKLFSAAGGKSQSAGILQEKVHELCNLVPALYNELNWSRGLEGSKESKDYCIYKFKNGSQLDNIAANEKARGKRRHAAVLEECVGIDQKILQEVLIPILAISRKAADGTKDREEALSRSQFYITTAGYKATFAYDKLIQTLVKMIIDPSSAFVIGGSYKIPVLTGQYEKTFVQDQKRDDTFDEAAFGREYESRWAGTVEGAFFNGEAFDRGRILQLPEHEHSGRSTISSYYILSVDVGRKGCESSVCVFKVIPQAQGHSIKSLVNIYSLVDEHFEDQAIAIKKLYFKYKARRLVIDGNGLGIGLLDYMIKTQVDPATGDKLVNFGIYNDPDGYYKKYQTNETEMNAIYIIKANAPINTEAHANAQANLNAGRIKFLIPENEAKNKLLGTKKGQDMSPEERKIYLQPFQYTTILREQMLNLYEDNEGVNIILKQANKRYPKDKFSAFEYGLYYIKQEEDSKKKRKRFNAKDWAFYN